MSLADFHSTVSSNVNKGTLHDAVIPAFVKQAGRWMERNYSFKYMERFVTFAIDPTSTYPRSIALPERFKSFNFIRIINADGSYSILNQVDPEDVISNDQATPTGYWLDGLDYIWMDNTPSEIVNLEMSYIQYADWPVSPYIETPWLLENGEEILLAQTMMLMAPLLREPDLLTLYKAIRDEGLRTLTLADEELRSSNRNEVMNG